MGCATTQTLLFQIRPRPEIGQIYMLTKILAWCSFNRTYTSNSDFTVQCLAPSYQTSPSQDTEDYTL